MDVYDEFTGRIDVSAVLIYDAKIEIGAKVLGRMVWKGKTCYLHIYGVGMTKGTIRGGCMGRIDDEALVKAAEGMLTLLRGRTAEDWKYWSHERIAKVNRLVLKLAEPGPKSWGRKLFELDMEGLVAL